MFYRFKVEKVELHKLCILHVQVENFYILDIITKIGFQFDDDNGILEQLIGELGVHIRNQ